MDYRLEVVVVPVADVDRAKGFYAEQMGFHVDHDSYPAEGMRVVQLTPPGSACSIVIGTGLSDMEPGSIKGLQLVVPDIHAARAQLVERGVDVGQVQVAGPTGFRPSTEGEEGEALDNVGFVFFDDPDGNSWAVQQISARGQGQG
jgi:catechol 2,3-dioxygenase-like lactoylglutathione lyase family enzyme